MKAQGYGAGLASNLREDPDLLKGVSFDDFVETPRQDYPRIVTPFGTLLQQGMFVWKCADCGFMKIGRGNSCICDKREQVEIEDI